MSLSVTPAVSSTSRKSRIPKLRPGSPPSSAAASSRTPGSTTTTRTPQTSKKARDKKGGGPLIKARPIPDFSRIHQQWSEKLQQDLAKSKKKSTVPQEFVLNQQTYSAKKVTQRKHTSNSAIFLDGIDSGNAGNASEWEDGLAEQDRSRDMFAFEADDNALHSILNNTGISRGRQNPHTPAKGTSAKTQLYKSTKAGNLGADANMHDVRRPLTSRLSDVTNQNHPQSRLSLYHSRPSSVYDRRPAAVADGRKSMAAVRDGKVCGSVKSAFGSTISLRKSGHQPPRSAVKQRGPTWRDVPATPCGGGPPRVPATPREAPRSPPELDGVIRPMVNLSVMVEDVRKSFKLYSESLNSEAENPTRDSQRCVSAVDVPEVVARAGHMVGLRQKGSMYIKYIPESAYEAMLSGKKTPGTKTSTKTPKMSKPAARLRMDVNTPGAPGVLEMATPAPSYKFKRRGTLDFSPHEKENSPLYRSHLNRRSLSTKTTSTAISNQKSHTVSPLHAANLQECETRERRLRAEIAENQQVRLHEVEADARALVEASTPRRNDHRVPPSSYSLLASSENIPTWTSVHECMNETALTTLGNGVTAEISGIAPLSTLWNDEDDRIAWGVQPNDNIHDRAVQRETDQTQTSPSVAECADGECDSVNSTVTLEMPAILDPREEHLPWTPCASVRKAALTPANAFSAASTAALREARRVSCAYSPFPANIGFGVNSDDEYLCYQDEPSTPPYPDYASSASKDVSKNVSKDISYDDEPLHDEHPPLLTGVSSPTQAACDSVHYEQAFDSPPAVLGQEHEECTEEIREVEPQGKECTKIREVERQGETTPENPTGLDVQPPYSIPPEKSSSLFNNSPYPVLPASDRQLVRCAHPSVRTPLSKPSDFVLPSPLVNNLNTPASICGMVFTPPSLFKDLRHDTVGSSHDIVGSSHNTVGSSHNTVGSAIQEHDEADKPSPELSAMPQEPKSSISQRELSMLSCTPLHQARVKPNRRRISDRAFMAALDEPTAEFSLGSGIGDLSVVSSDDEENMPVGLGKERVKEILVGRSESKRATDVVEQISASPVCSINRFAEGHCNTGKSPPGNEAWVPGWVKQAVARPSLKPIGEGENGVVGNPGNFVENQAPIMPFSPPPYAERVGFHNCPVKDASDNIQGELPVKMAYTPRDNCTSEAKHVRCLESVTPPEGCDEDRNEDVSRLVISFELSSPECDSPDEQRSYHWKTTSGEFSDGCEVSFKLPEYYSVKKSRPKPCAAQDDASDSSLLPTERLCTDAPFPPPLHGEEHALLGEDTGTCQSPEQRPAAKVYGQPLDCRQSPVVSNSPSLASTSIVPASELSSHASSPISPAMSEISPSSITANFAIDLMEEMNCTPIPAEQPRMFRQHLRPSASVPSGFPPNTALVAKAGPLQRVLRRSGVRSPKVHPIAEYSGTNNSMLK